MAAQKATYEQQLQAAQIHLLELQGARNAYRQWVAQKRGRGGGRPRRAERRPAMRPRRQPPTAAQQRRRRRQWRRRRRRLRPARPPAASPAASAARWGALHGGVDIAAPIGTPIYAATSGVVKRAGAATGFGLAVYILGDDGAVTVYGHVNRYFVTAGERVSAGEQIAEVGNRGQSTGPHLHFEVHTGGELYSGQINPVPWLNARGIYLGGCGG